MLALIGVATSPMLVQPGERVAGRFEIESLAGTGGMGAVYRARDLQTGERVALKLLRHDAQHRERFLREARLLAGMQHPGIVRYVDSGETPEGAPFLAMEWLEGETLDARLARASSPSPRAWRWSAASPRPWARPTRAASCTAT